MFPVFHLTWSTCRATKTLVGCWRKLLRKVERGSTLSNKFWLCCSFFIKLTTCRATNLLVPYKSTNQRAAFLQPATNVFVVGQVDQARWKTRNIEGGEIRDTKTLNSSRNIVSLQVLVDVWRFSPCLINLTRNKNICCGLKKCDALIGWFARHELICCSTSCEFDEKRADPRSTFRNKFLQPATNVFVARQVDHARWKTRNIDKNLQRNIVARQVEGSCVSYFAALTKTCNETMLRDKLRVFVSRISPR